MPDGGKGGSGLRDLIVFGEDWGADPSSTQHLIRHLAPGRRVVWVNSIGMRRPQLSAADLGRAAAKLRRAVLGGAPATVREPAPFPLVNALAIPMAEGAPGRAVNRRLIGRAVRAAAAAAGLRRPVVWASLPSAMQALGGLGESAVVYDCCDDIGALAGVDHAPAPRMEAELARRADLILASSPVLADRFEAARTHLLPHGVDCARFATPAPRADDLPDGGPVAGFYGTLAPWLDRPLVAAAARLLPQWRFVLIGHPATDLSPLRGLADIRLLGPRPHAALRSYAQRWTAWIIPFLGQCADPRQQPADAAGIPRRRAAGGQHALPGAAALPGAGGRGGGAGGLRRGAAGDARRSAGRGRGARRWRGKAGRRGRPMPRR